VRIRSAVLATAVAAVALTLVGTAPAIASPASSFTCTGTLGSPETVPSGSYSQLSMPAGSICFIAGPVTVARGIALGDTSGLALFDGNLTVRGPVTVGPNALFGDAGGAAPIVVNGSVAVEQNAAFLIGFENPFAPLVSAVHGPVTGDNASTVQLHNTDISGRVTLQGGGGDNPILDVFAGGGYNFNDLEDNAISGGVTESSYQGIWAGVIRNHISGNLTFTNNTDFDEFDVGSNVVHGNADCSGNSPAVNTGGSPGSPNTVSGNNTCG
jgi:hypothetical protein